MKALEKIIHAIGRFSFGIGLGIALVCAYVIVSSPPAPRCDAGRTPCRRPSRPDRRDHPGRALRRDPS